MDKLSYALGLSMGHNFLGSAIEITEEADIFVVIGTSLNVYPAAGLLRYVRPQVPIYLIDPKEVKVPVDRSVRVIQKGASEGVAELIALLRR